MLNKRNIIIGVVILVVIVGVALLSRNDSTPDSSTLQKGVKNLTREKAAEMIKTSFEVRPELGLYLNKTAAVYYNEKTGGYTCGFMGSFNSDNKISKLAEMAFIKMTGQKDDYGNQVFEFTDKAEPYLKEGGEKKKKYFVLAEIISVEVTGITEATEKDGKTVRVADFIAKFKPTPIGVINDEEKAAEDIKTQAQFILYDDGWRIAQ